MRTGDTETLEDGRAMLFADSVRPSVLALILGAAFVAMIVAYLAVARGVALRLDRGEPVIPWLPPKPRMVPWGWRSVLAIIATVYLATSLVAFLFVVGGPRRTAPEKGAPRDRSELKFSPPEQMLISSFSNVIVLTLGPLLLRWTSHARRADLGFVSRSPVRDIGIGFGAFLLVTPLVMLASFAAQMVFEGNKHQLEKMLRAEPGQDEFVILALISAVVLAPLAEEFVFRGVIQGWLRRVYLGRHEVEASLDPIESDVEAASPRFSPKSGLPIERLMPIVITSAFFGILHFDQMPAPIPIFLLSLALGALYEWTESLVPSIVLHALFNAFNTVALLLMIRGKAG